MLAAQELHNSRQWSSTAPLSVQLVAPKLPGWAAGNARNELKALGDLEGRQPRRAMPAEMPAERHDVGTRPLTPQHHLGDDRLPPLRVGSSQDRRVGNRGMLEQ